MVMEVIRMVLPVLIMIGLGALCRKKNIFDQRGLAGIKAIIGDVMLPVVLFNAFLTAKYSVRVLVIFVVVYLGYGIALGSGFFFSRFVKPYNRFFPFLMASAEGGMLGYALYGLIVGEQSGFASVDLGQTVFAFTIWLGFLSMADGGKADPKSLLKNMISNKCFDGMALGILLGATGIGGLIMESAAGPLASSVISMITAPVSGVVLLTVGYELNLRKELLGPVMKTIVFRLVIMGVLLLISNLIIFSIYPFDQKLEIAMMVLYSLPAPFIIPIFANVGEDGEYISTSISMHMLCTVALFAAIVAYSVM